MPPFHPMPPEADFHQSIFVGVHPELCFAPTWLSRARRGYATLTAKEFRGTMHAHRLVVMLLLGPIRDDGMALHRCGNAACHNPYHLYVGGDEENRRDKLLHQRADPRWGKLGLTRPVGQHHVHMPHPLALSEEPSHLAMSFGGFTPGKCFHCDWLHPTSDGFRQLCETDLSGEVVGAHRKVYQLFNGPLDRYDILSHTCGDATCLNPFHLVISGCQAFPRDFDVKHDKRFRLSAYGLALIADFSRRTSDVAEELGVHRQTVSIMRTDLRRSLKGNKSNVRTMSHPQSQAGTAASPPQAQ